MQITNRKLQNTVRIGKTEYTTRNTSYRTIIMQKSKKTVKRHFTKLSVILDTSSLFKWFLRFPISNSFATEYGD